MFTTLSPAPPIPYAQSFSLPIFSIIKPRSKFKIKWSGYDNSPTSYFTDTAVLPITVIMGTKINSLIFLIKFLIAELFMYFMCPVKPPKPDSSAVISLLSFRSLSSKFLFLPLRNQLFLYHWYSALPRAPLPLVPHLTAPHSYFETTGDRAFTL